MCWLVGHGITGSHGRCFVVVDACPKKGILSTRAAFNGPYTRVREARNGFGSAALTIFFPIGLSKMAQYGQLFSAAAEIIHRCHASDYCLSRDLITVCHETLSSEVRPDSQGSLSRPLKQPLH